MSQLKLTLSQSVIGRPVFDAPPLPAGEYHETYGQAALRAAAAEPAGHVSTLSFRTAGLDAIEPAQTKARSKVRAELEAIAKAVEAQTTEATKTRDRYAKDIAAIDRDIAGLAQKVPVLEAERDNAVTRSDHDAADRAEAELSSIQARLANRQDRRTTVERLLRDAEAVVSRERAAALNAKQDDLFNRLNREVEKAKEAVGPAVSKAVTDLAIAEAALSAFNPPAPEPQRPYEPPPKSPEELERWREESARQADADERRRELAFLAAGGDPNRMRSVF